MFRLRTLMVTTLVALLVSVAWLDAAASLIVPTSDNRSISAAGSPPPDFNLVSESAVPSTPFAPFNATVNAGSEAEAQQDSIIGESFLLGNGSFAHGNETESGGSIFLIDFDLAILVSFSLTGELFESQGTTDTRLRLSRGATVLIDEVGTISSNQIDEGGVLIPGSYQLLVQSVFTGSPGGDAGLGSWSFAMNVVPEPSTALLLALGLVGLAVGRRRAA